MKRRRALLIFLIASAAAVAAGAAVLAVSGSPVSTWVRNPASWALGALVALAAARLKQPAHFTAVCVAGLVALLATFAAAPVQSVHRWIDFGPLHVNAAGLVLPAIVASLARIEAVALKLAIVVGVGAILVLQPDASQATAFAAASLVLLFRAIGSSSGKALVAVICLAVAVFAWFRPDTLEPVAEVEGIFGLASSVSVLLAAVAAAALAASCLAPLGAGRRAGDGAIALAVYFAITALAPLVGAYPVPLMGLGMSFPFGWWLGVALVGAPSKAILR